MAAPTPEVKILGPQDSIVVRDIVAQGGFGQVFRVQVNGDPREMALKIFKILKGNRSRALESALVELHALQLVAGNIHCLGLGYVAGPGFTLKEGRTAAPNVTLSALPAMENPLLELAIITPLHDTTVGGYYELRNHKSTKFTDEARLANVRLLAQDIGDALLHMHSRGMVHQDVKPENILVDLSGRYRQKGTPFHILSDLGNGRGPGAEGRKPTRDFSPPEKLMGQPYGFVVSTLDASPQTDVWGLGMTLMCVLGKTTTFLGHLHMVYAQSQAQAQPQSKPKEKNDFERRLEVLDGMFRFIGDPAQWFPEVRLHRNTYKTGSSQMKIPSFAEAMKEAPTDRDEYLRAPLKRLGITYADRTWEPAVKQMLAVNPKERPSIKRILQDRWLQQAV